MANKITAFKNPTNGYVEWFYDSNAFWCTLLFGCVYFAIKGIWTHAAASLVLAIATAGISLVIYPFFGKRILMTHYMRRGWVPVSNYDPKKPLVPSA